MLEGKKPNIKTTEGFAALPADKYTVQIVDVNLKTQLKYQSTEEEEVLNYQFQVLDDNPIPEVEEGEQATTRGRYLWKAYRLALNSRSNLGKLAAAVEGRALTKAEAKQFDPETIVGKQLDVMVEQKPSTKDPEIIYNNVISHSKTVKELEPIPIEKKTNETVEKTTSGVVPQTAPTAKPPDAKADKFINDLEAEKQGTVVEEEEEEDPEVLEAKLKLAKAKAKAKAAKK